MIRNGTTENPNGVISLPPIVGASIGCTQPHLLLRRIPKTIRPRPAADRAAPTTSSFGGCSGSRRRLHPLAHDQDDDDDHDLADEDVAPGEVRRHPAADHRPDRDRSSGDPADDPEGEGAILALVVGGGERRDGGNHQHRPEAFDERPADQEDGEIRAERGRQRAEPVDGEPDAEGTVAPPDVAELRADEHERRHHQRVHGDRGLDAVTVVSRSATICEIETFITLESSTITNCAAARMISGSQRRTERLYFAASSASCASNPRTSSAVL